MVGLIELSVIVIVIYAMSIQLLDYLPLRLPSTKVRRKTGCWILLFS